MAAPASGAALPRASLPTVPPATVPPASVPASTAVTCCLLRSSGYPRQLEPGRRDQLPLDLVDPAAEGQHRVALGLDVQPARQLGCAGVGRITMTSDDLLQQLAEMLQPFGGEDLRGGRDRK